MEKHLSLNPLTITSSDETQQLSNPVRKFSDSIPIDLLIDIFSRVPAKSIARFRCLSKFWAYIFCRPDFTELFLITSSARPRLFFALTVDYRTLSFYSTPQPHKIDEDTSLVATLHHTFVPGYFPTIRTPVCGLALFEEYSSKVWGIYNPATHEFLNLPKVESRSNSDQDKDLYLCYDPINKQFKVLCMTMSYEGSPTTHLVMTLESGKKLSWRSIDRKFNFKWDNRRNGGICIDGVLYFRAYFEGYVIVSFDVRSEKFDFINTVEVLPITYYYYSWNSVILFNYKGQLGLHIEKHGWSNHIKFWVLEDGGNHKWSNHVYDLEYYSAVDRTFQENKFVGVTATGEMVWSNCHVKDDVFIIFYNLERKTLRRVKIQGLTESVVCNGPCDLVTFLDYVENISKDNTWSNLKILETAHQEREKRLQLQKQRERERNEKRVLINNKRNNIKISSSTTTRITSNSFDILASLLP